MTTLKVFLFVVVIAVLGVLEKASAHYVNEADISETLNHFETKLDKLDDKLDVVDKKLDILLGKLGNDTEGNAQGEGDEGDTAVPVGPVELISVERVSLEFGRNRFTVRMRNTSEGDLDFRIFVIGDERVPDDIADEGGEEIAVSFNISPDEEMVFFEIMDLNSFTALTLNLKNGLDSSRTQDLGNFEIPKLQISPETDAVYDQDENVTITVTVFPQDPSASYLDSISKAFRGVDLTSGNYIFEGFGDFEIEEYVHPESPDKPDRSVSYLLATAVKPVSGYFSLTMSSNMEDNEESILNRFQIMKGVIVRPSNQTGPFPPGYLRFMDQPWYEKSKNGNEMRSCSVGEECSIDCFAVGETVSDITVMKVEQDGGMTYVPSSRNPPQYMPTLKTLYWKFQAHADSGDSDGITTFMCSAYDENTGQNAVKLVDVQTTMPGTIDSDESSVQVEVDPTDPTQRRITLNCAVSGRPLPEAVFVGGDDNAYWNPSSPDNVISSGPNKAIAQKIITVGPQEIEAMESGLSQGYNCDIIALNHGNVTSFHFNIPLGEL